MSGLMDRLLRRESVKPEARSWSVFRDVWLKSQGVWVAGLAMAGAQTVFQADFKGPLALVIGGEEKGLRPLVQKQCDFLVSIPMRGRVDSLNASAAAAVVLYEAYRQRHAGCVVAT